MIENVTRHTSEAANTGPSPLAGSMPLHVRPSVHGGWLGPLWRGRVLGTGRATRELQVASRLAAAGAPVARPALVAGERRLGLWRVAIAYWHERDAVDATAFLASAPGPPRTLRAAAAAGRALRVPVPTLSRKISELEASLGTRLLIRTTRKLTLTDVGVTYVAAARRILEQVEDAEREAAGEFTTPKGELVITAPIMFGRLHVLPIVIDFLALFPEINIRLQLADRNVHLVDDHVDMAVRIGQLPDEDSLLSLECADG